MNITPHGANDISSPNHYGVRQVDVPDDASTDRSGSLARSAQAVVKALAPSNCWAFAALSPPVPPSELEPATGQHAQSDSSGAFQAAQPLALTAWRKSFQDALDDVEGPVQALRLLREVADAGELAKIEVLDFTSLGLQSGHLSGMGEWLSQHHDAMAFTPTGLNFKLNDLGPQGPRALRAWPCLEQLRELHLGATGLGDKGVESLVAGPFTALEKLHLWSNDLSPACAQVLIGSALWSSLVSLDLGDNHLGDDGAEILSQVPATQLRELNVQWNGLSVRGAEVLGSCFRDTEVKLHDNKIKQATALALAARYPTLKF